MNFSNIQSLLEHIKTPEFLSTYKSELIYHPDIPTSVEEETNTKLAEYEKLQNEIFPKLDKADDDDETPAQKTLRSNLKKLINNEYFDVNDFGAKRIYTLFDWRYFDILGLLIEKHAKELDDQALNGLLCKFYEDSFDFKANITEKMTKLGLIYSDISLKILNYLNIDEGDKQMSTKISFQIYFTLMILKASPALTSFKASLMHLDSRKILKMIEILYLICSRLSYDLENNVNFGDMPENMIGDYLSAALNILYLKKEGILDAEAKKTLKKINDYINTKINEYAISTYLEAFENVITKDQIKNASGMINNVIKIEEFEF